MIWLTERYCCRCSPHRPLWKNRLKRKKLDLVPRLVGPILLVLFLFASNQAAVCIHHEWSCIILSWEHFSLAIFQSFFFYLSAEIQARSDMWYETSKPKNWSSRMMPLSEDMWIHQVLIIKLSAIDFADRYIILRFLCPSPFLKRRGLMEGLHP